MDNNKFLQKLSQNLLEILNDDDPLICEEFCQLIKKRMMEL
jgi:hypothetical protein